MLFKFVNFLLKIKGVIAFYPKFLFNSVFSSEFVILFSGGKTGTSFNVATKLLDRGYKIILVSDRSKLLEKVISSKYINVDYDDFDPNIVYKKVKIHKPIGVLTGCGEHYLLAATELSEIMQLKSISHNGALISNNKELISKSLKSLNSKMSIPIKGHEDYIKDFHSKCIIKPVDGAGNLGVFTFESGADALDFGNEIDGFIGSYIFEPFIEGDQFDIEGVSCDGEHIPFGITLEKYLPLNEKGVKTHWFLFNPKLECAFKIKLFEYAKTFLDEVGVTNGAWHLEVKVDRDLNIYWIDFGNRVGGTFEYTLEQATGYPFLDNYINTMVGQKLENKRFDKCEILRVYPQVNGEFEKLKAKSKMLNINFKINSHPCNGSYGELEFYSDNYNDLLSLLLEYKDNISYNKFDLFFNNICFDSGVKE